MSRRTTLQVRAMNQRAGRYEQTKTQPGYYLAINQNKVKEKINEIFPVRGDRTDRKVTKIVNKFPR